MIEYHKFYLKRIFKKYAFIIIIIILIIIFYIKIKIYDNKSSKTNFLLDIDHFQYIIKNDICNEDIFLLILIHSAANHFHHRNLIRNTWGRPDVKLPKVKVVFLLAVSHELQNDIAEENILHHDIIQGNFIDSYHNLTYKHVMGLKWASEHCAKVQYLMKMDDDIFMDIYQFIDYIRKHFTFPKLRNNIACFLQSGMPVVRDPVSKWYVSKSEYPSDMFENYCSGWAYLTTTEVAHCLVKAVKQLNYFWVDDVHITGSAAKVANISHIKINSLFDLESNGLAQWSNNSINMKWNKMFAPTWGDLVLSRKAYKKTLMCHVMQCKCCYVRKTTPIPTQPSTTRKGEAKILSIF